MRFNEFNNRIKVCLFMITVILLSGCYESVDPLPDTEIVFQTMPGYKGLPHYLGFFNADGTGLAYIELPHSGPGSPAAPVRTSDAELLLFYTIPGADRAYSPGKLYSITKAGKIRKYGDSSIGRVTPVIDTHQVLFTSYDNPAKGRYSLRLLDLDKNSVVKTYYATDQGIESGLVLGTNALHGSKLVFARYSKQTYPEIILLDIETGTERLIFIEDHIEDDHAPLYPAISPDGRWVAYTTHGGIYVMNLDTHQRKRIVTVATIYEHRPGWIELVAWPPAPSWSPDSQWIVYHRCIQPIPDQCEDTDDYVIFKANIQTGEEIKLLEGGLNPYWRLDSQDHQ